ncbi:sensor histidine kinase [Clostridium aminobutyricum]|uniref:histidine kinase n=1 Tax=Clostridium aminobutyricum TaxID=33953 RepID=A0A939IJR3_CLOAM|nr:HAMP domain-containing sensor histidine kinase [Clostridium aminobutyricum]MBN7773863.1 HAMP domain-containing histidine kinase [Clostridium aminobutyricum]
MDIRLKKFNDNLAVRILAFVLCISTFVGTLVGLQATVMAFNQANRSFTLNDLFQDNSYLYSADLQGEFENQVHNMIQLICYYKSEDYIKAGNLLNQNDGELAEAINSLYYNNAYITEAETIIPNEISAVIEGADQIVDFGNPAFRQAFIAANKDQIDIIKSNLIKKQLREFNQLKDELNRIEGFTYYATNGTNVITNLQVKDTGTPKESVFEKNPAYLIYQNGKITKFPTSMEASASVNPNMDQELENRLFGQYNDDLKIYFSFDEQYMTAAERTYQSVSGIRNWLPGLAGCALICFLLFIYLAVTTGRRDEEGNRKLYKIDRIWTEVQLVFIILSIGGGIALAAEAMYSYHRYSYTNGQLGIFIVGYAQYAFSKPEIIMFIAAAGLLALVGLWFILSCIRLLKARQFIKNSFVYLLWQRVVCKICHSLGSKLIDIYKGSSLVKKVMFLAAAGCLLSATVFLAPVVLLVILVFTPKWVKKFEAIQNGVDEVKNGNLAYKIEVKGDDEFDQLARGINEISEASNVAIQNELKNQRLKTDLISNVSHDLKTPLTSMVTYIDLLKSEGLTSENASEYLRIIDEKTNRLRQLTEDLFEAAKASSGAMPVRLEKVELLSLIHQGLGEMDQSIQYSGLDFIINTEKEKYYVVADGQLLWRVVENLLSNVIKYAAENSRVYIDITEQGTSIMLEMKNISKQPLNISSDELMERFKRGDESRTTEGSGLGLAIAKDLVRLQKGWFEIVIDGDLFKARVMLNKPQ